MKDQSEKPDTSFQKTLTSQKTAKRTTKSSVYGGKRKNKTEANMTNHISRLMIANAKKYQIHVDTRLYENNPELLEEIKKNNLSVENFINDLKKLTH